MAHELDITDGHVSFANARSDAWHRLGQSVGHTMTAWEALDKGKDDRSVRADLNTSTAARDIVITGVGIAYAWIVLPGTDLHAELARWRGRIINNCART